MTDNKLTYQDMIDIGYPKYWVDLSLRISKNMMLKAKRQRYREIVDAHMGKKLEQTNVKNK